MRIFLAELISLIFHPVVLAFLMPFVIVYRHTGSGIYALKWEIFSAAFMLVGIALLLMGRWKGFFSDSDITRREERYNLYILSFMIAFLYFAAALFFKGILFPLSIVSLGIILATGIFLVVNHFLKASIHMGVVCAFVVAVGALYGWTAFFLVLLTIPLVFWSRIVLKRHTLREAIAGGVLGSLVTLLTILIGKYLLYS